ncbi:outer membrane protein assembly factor BamE [Bosea sp. TND4EK4]|uniref:outer membrane protein assembly factor BamE n=1 Tax=Bosea sp. TND4EK4 TaxID=1907408 RepID=UPI000954A975|nr:outer membrane protein assembly factor BamE [Bosea sp. TND4EK4]SIP93505.1 Beta-barrel assembly machine subunit BamE [Bosea sp. TND4EK4]
MTLITRRTALLGALATTTLTIAGCGPDAGGFVLPTSAGLNEEFKRGFVMDDALVAQVKVGMDVHKVLEILGTPSTTSTVGNRTFYYISQTVRRRFQFQDPQVIDQQVLVVYFNKGFKVERIAHYGLQDGVIFDFISRTTASGGQEQSFLRNLFRGVTKFNPLGS